MNTIERAASYNYNWHFYQFDSARYTHYRPIKKKKPAQ
jgi:hypothetical protein